MSVITVAELATYLKRDFTPEQEAAAAEIIPGVQAELELYLGRPVEIRTFADEEHRLEGDDNAVYFRHTPVVQIGAIAIDGSALDASKYTLRRWGLEGVLGYGLSAPLTSSAPLLTVTYDAGYDGTDESANPGIRSVLMRASGREMNRVCDDAVGIKSLIVEGYNVNYEDLFTEPELKRLRRYKRRQIR